LEKSAKWPPFSLGATQCLELIIFYFKSSQLTVVFCLFGRFILGLDLWLWLFKPQLLALVRFLVFPITLVLTIGELVVDRHALVLVALALPDVGFLDFFSVHLHGVLGDGLHLYTGRVRQHSQVFKKLILDFVQVLGCVLIGHVGGADVQLKVGAKVFKVVCVGKLVGDVLAQRHRRLVRPAPRHVADGVAAAAHHQQRDVVLLDEFYALAVTLDGQIEATEAISGEGVGAALQHDCVGLKRFHHLGYDGFENAFVTVVVDAIAQRNVDRVVLSLIQKFKMCK
jgi:hypothetical protein